METCPIEPLNGYIVVTLIDPPDRSAGGIFFPGTSSVTMTRGAVVGVPRSGKYMHDHEWCEMTVKKDDVVLFHKSNATEFGVADQKYFLVRENQLYGTLKNVG